MASSWPYCLLLVAVFINWSELKQTAADDLADAISNARSYGLCLPPNATNAPNNDGQDQLPCVCTKMVPRSMHFPSQTTPCPWKITPFTTILRQHYSQTITLGSADPDNVFQNYIVTAKSTIDGHIVGHFEYQWDAIAVCCYLPGRNYTYEGKKLHPNLLVGAQSIRIPKPNQTVVWTSPRYYEGGVVIVATFWKSAKLYWSNVTSPIIQIVKRNLTDQPSAAGRYFYLDEA